MKKWKELSLVACVPAIFCTYTAYLYALATVYQPALSTSPAEPQAEVRFPTSLADLSQLAQLLKLYKNDHPLYVLLLFCSAYFYKQCFAIPGSVFMNLLAGALFGTLWGFPLCCLLTACGASGCYLLSRHFGKRLIQRAFRRRLEPLQRRVRRDDGRSLFGLLLSLRLFPMSPNWFLNVASPLLNVPLTLFFPSVLIGLMPYNFITVQAGCMLGSLTSIGDLLTPTTLLQLTAVSAAVAAFVLLKRRFSGGGGCSDSGGLIGGSNGSHHNGALHQDSKGL